LTIFTRLIGNLVKRGSLTIRFASGSSETFGAGEPHYKVRFTDKRVPLDLIRNTRLAIGEAYMDGRIVIEDGSILDLLELIVGANPWEEGGKRGRTGMSKNRWQEIRKLFRRNRPGRAKRNVAHHYDLDDRLYDLFLDPMRQYSCAYFTDPANSLEQAQLDKLAHIAAKLDLRPGQRVLDIGCGWGGLAIYLNRVAGVEVLGVTLSEEQLKYARDWASREGVADQVKFDLIDYRSVAGNFDRIVSIGMFEHVGAAHYSEFFGKCRDLLADDGVMLLHTIGKLGGAGSPDPFTDKWIFPGYHIPSLSQMSTASETVRMITSDVEILRLHYGLTLREWLRRCEMHKAKIVAIYDERFFRMWEFYLAGAIVMFESGAACNFQIQYIRDRRALPITRDYIGKAEAKYRKPS
jgi:cyclopropane-fatty-acyl-phospholipid synthase